MPTVNNTNLGFPPCFWLILRYAHGLYGKVLSRSRALSYPKNTTENLFTTENAEISDDFWKRRTRLYFSYYKRAFYIKALKYRRFGNDIVQTVSAIFHGAFRWLFFFNQNHLCADEYAATVCAMKSTQLIQGRTTLCVTSTQEQYPSLFGKRFNLCRSQNDVQNTKAFSQQTIHAQIKRNNRMDQRALILTQGLTTATLQCTVRP